MKSLRAGVHPFLARSALVSLLLGSAMAGTSLGISITVTSDPNTLVSTILGPGITLVGVPTYTGAATAAGTFTGGVASGLGIESGILLTTGSAADATGPNNNGTDVPGGADDTSTDHMLSGDANLTDLAGVDTFDASVLQFTFESAGGDLFFNYVFASEEYLDFVGTEFNDVFGFFVDGVNIGLVPGTLDPVSVNTINPSTNAAFYKNNVNPALFVLEYDGFSTVLTASVLGLTTSESHTMKLAIADGADGLLDSSVFIQAGTFSGQPTPVPEPSTSLLIVTGLLVVLRASRGRLRKT